MSTINPITTSSTSTQFQTKSTTRHVCPICSQTFGRTEHLERHIAAHKGSRPWMCEYCRSRFSRKDVMYRHHNTCQAAHDAGFRRGIVPKKSKRRSCERCSRLKCKCDDDSPCGRCAAAGVECNRAIGRSSQGQTPIVEEDLTNIHLLAHHASQTPKEILSPAVISPEALPNSMNTSQSVTFQDAFDHAIGNSDGDENINLFDWSLFDTNIGNMDNLLPDTDEILREMFKTLNNPQTNALHVDSGVIIPDPTVDEQLCDWNLVSIAMNKIDPLETHRLTINQHLLRAGTISEEDIAWLSPHKVREMVYCFFRHFHRHTPIIHLPTWDISTTPSSLLLSMILLGAVYSDDPETNAPPARRIATEAKSLIFSLDHGAAEGTNPTLESIQALYLLNSFSTFYVGMEQCRKTRREYTELIDLARKSGLFHALHSTDNPTRTWEEWVYEEKRKRTAFCIYLLDCGYVLFFGDRPRVAPYELRHSLPAHEHVYEARTAFEWQISFTQTNQAEYPVLLEMLLSPQVERHPPDISVMGNFLLLHGLHVHIWTSQQYEPALGGSPGLGTSLADQRHAATSFALAKWRDGWVASKLHTHPAQTIGLYQEKGMMWWVLAKFLHEKKALPFFPEGGIASWTDSERVQNILKIIKAIHLTVESGAVKEENLSPEIVKNPPASPPREKGDVENLNSMTISFIMERKSDAS